MCVHIKGAIYPLGMLATVSYLRSSCHSAHLSICAGAKTGRSPRDKRVVREAASEKDIWWAAPDGQPSNGAPNYEMDERCALALSWSRLPQLWPMRGTAEGLMAMALVGLWHRCAFYPSFSIAAV